MSGFGKICGEKIAGGGGIFVLTREGGVIYCKKL